MHTPLRAGPDPGPPLRPLVDITVMRCFSFLPCSPGVAWERLARWVDPALAERAGRVNQATRDDPASYDHPRPRPWSWELPPLRTTWVFFRRSQAADDDAPRRVVDVRLMHGGDTGSEEGWVRVPVDIRKGIKHAERLPPAYVSYRLDVSGTNETQLPSVTELDVIYGDNAPLPGYSLVDGPIVPEGQSAGSSLAVQHTPLARTDTPLMFRPDGSFKILQLADLHFSLTAQECRDVHHKHLRAPCKGELQTTALIARWLEEEKPDLVVLSGDQLNGVGTSWDERSTLMRVLRPLLERGVPFAAIGGNHDSQSGFLTRRGLQELYASIPHSKTGISPPGIFGAGNFHLPILQDGAQLATLYFLDSGAHTPLDEGVGRYGYVHQDQAEWFTNLSSSITSASARKPLGLMFQHIPVPEAFGPVDAGADGRPLIIGERREDEGAPGAQGKSGIFDLLVQTQDTVVLAHGHMHLNSDCRRIRGVWVCFAGSASWAAYGDADVERSGRIFLLDNWGGGVSTYLVYQGGGRDAPCVLRRTSEPTA